jgi:PAS domain S-box-containing protein
MKKQTGLTVIGIAGFVWLLHTVYLQMINPELTFIQAFIAGPRIPDILFRLILLFLVITLALGRVKYNTSAKMEEYIKLKKAVDTSGEVIFITDRDGIFAYVNPEFTNVYGFQAEEIIGNKTPRILKSNVMSPENYQKFWQHILQKQVVKGEIINKTKSGELIDVESSANPILNAKDEIIGFLSIQRDITERKLREKALQESEKTARAMLNASDDPVYLVDRHGEFLSANEAAMLMLDVTPDDLVGKKIADFDIFGQTKHADKIMQVIRSEDKICFEEKIHDRYYDITVYPLFDVDGQLSRLAIFHVDTTEQKAAKETIRNQNQFLHSVIEALEHPFFVIDVHDYSVKLANSAAKGSSELNDIPCYALTHNASEPCQTAEHICPLYEIKKSRQPVVTRHIHYDQDGNRRDVEVHAFPIFDADGELEQMIEYTLDITGRSSSE